MKKIGLLSIICFFICSNVSSQVINLNPDPKGEPWIIGPGNSLGDASEPFEVNSEALSQILEEVDNSNEIFFYTIFNQSPLGEEWNSCAQAAGVTYTFGYEINRFNKANGDLDENTFPFNYTWNYLDSGIHAGSVVKQGWNIIKDNGCPNLINWGEFYQDLVWMDGYHKYESASWNRIKDFYPDNSYVDINIPSTNTINDLKTWISNHNQVGAESGGLAVFTKKMENFTEGTVGPGPFYQEKYIHSWSTGENEYVHAMTLVGYNDYVNCGNDGTGAFKVANSWGQWMNQGFIWLPYKLVEDEHLFASGIKEVEYRQPSVIAKIKLRYNPRDHIMLYLNISNDPHGIAPANYWEYSKKFVAMSYRDGGPLPMNGQTDDPIEIGWDISDYVNANFSSQEFPRLKFILGIRELDDNNNQYNGEICDFSILDYRDDPEHPFEVFSHEQNVPIINNGMTNMTVDYFVLPDIINQTGSINYNCIVRDNISISSPNTINFSGNYLDFYDNGNLNVLAGATLNIASFVTIHTERETGKISIFGGLGWANYISVVDRQLGGHFTLYIENPNLNLTINQCTYLGVLNVKQADNLIISNSGFNQSKIINNYGDISILDNSFTNSTIDILHPGSLASSCEITGNTFTNGTSVQTGSVISIEDYTKFLIENCTINYAAKQGIEVFYAGWNATGNRAIRHNTIHFSGTAYPQFAELGIHSYFSNASIENNHISNNDYGITGFHGSDLSVMGVSSAQDDQHTQLIEDNTVSQCIFSYGSFPFEFQYNVLKDLSTGNKPFIKAVDYEEILPDTNQSRDLRGSSCFHVENNCWVDDNNDPSDRLLPLNAYCWRNIWCPGGGHLKSDNIPATMYYEAMNNIEAGNYQEAETGFKEIIAEYPEDNFAQASLKGLFGLNPALHDTDYTFLKQYCDSLSLNPGDSLLGKTAEWLSIHCNIREKEYQSAIYSLDSIINNPGTLADSVFALIDLSYVFNEANNNSGSKVTLVTKHPDVIPESNAKYVIQRKEWIDLLLRGDESFEQGSIDENELNENFESGKISSIHPNPSNGNFSIEYSLDKKSLVSISILSSSGQMLAQIQKGVLEKGEYHESFIDLGLPAGIYYVSLCLDNVITDCSKMAILK